MKTLKITVIAIIVSAFTFGSSVAGINLSENQSKDQKVGFVSNPTHDRVIVSFDRNSSESYEITIADLEGKTYHSEVVEGNGVFAKRYDLEELVDGEYVISIEGENSGVASQRFIKR